MDVDAAASKRVYNFLILGETGVGKSTFINAFMNYVNFPTLNDALQADKIHALIPSRFTILDADYNSREVKLGEDKNESFAVGESSTQQCRSYRFEFDDITIRLIDTPGIGDTRGVQRDQENFENLLTYLGEFRNIGAIVIMLKPNESRVTVLFEYCIKQLLSSLERSAIDNILFLFTNSRGTFYRPGDTVGPLRAVLQEIASRPPHVTVPFSKTNTFCLDNEAFRFLLAKRDGHDFDEDALESFQRSWDTSVAVSKRLIKYVTGLKAHVIQNTVSVMDARRTIDRLRIPLGEIAELIENNLARIERLESNLSDKTRDIDDLTRYLYVQRINLEVNKLDYPMTVCAATSCTDAHRVEDSTKINYRTICHGHCYLSGVPKEVLGDHRLQNCRAMHYKNGIATCHICGHTYLQHMHIYYTTEPYDEEKKDEVVDQKISARKVEAEDIEKELQRYRALKKDYEDERGAIQKAVAKFAHFLSNSVILPYNDAYKDYIQYLIEKERKLGTLAKQDVIKKFLGLIDRYEEEKGALMRALEEAQKRDSDVKTVVSADEVMRVIQGLYNLKLTGKTIKQMYDAQQRHTAHEIVQRTEKVLEPISLKGIAVIKSAWDWITGGLKQTAEKKPTAKTTTRTMTTTVPVTE